MRVKSLVFIVFTIYYLQFTTDVHGFSKNARGTSSAEFLKLGAGARAQALGEAYTTLADDALALYWNPAGLAWGSGPSLSFSHGLYIEEASFGSLYYGHTPQSWGSFGLGLQYASWGTIKQTNTNGVEIGSFNPKDLAFLGSYGYKTNILAGLSFGLTGKLVQSKIINTAQALAFDLGIKSPSWAFLKSEWQTGLALQNMGGKLKFDQNPDPLPLNLRWGLALRPLSLDLVLSGELIASNNNTPQMGLGSEYTFHLKDLALSARAGINTRLRQSQSKSQGLSLGFGIFKAPFSLDYAFIPMGYLGATHRLSLGIHFAAEGPLSPIGTGLDPEYKKAQKLSRSGQLLEARREFVFLEAYGTANPYAKETQRAIQTIDVKIKNMETKKKETLIAKHLSSGLKHFSQGNNIEAQKDFEDILRLDPGNKTADEYIQKLKSRYYDFVQEKIAALAQEGEAAFNEDRVVEAIGIWSKALALDPNNLELATKTEFARKKFAAAEQQVQRSQEQEKEMEMLLNRAQALYRSKEDRKALEVLDQILKISNEHLEAKNLRNRVVQRLSETQYQEALLKQKLGNLDEAVADLKIAADLGHGQALKLLTQLELEIRSRNKSQAEELAIRALRLYGSGKVEEAIALWEKALRFDPSNQKAQQNLEAAKKELELRPH